MCSLHDVWLSVIRLSVLSMMPVRDGALCRTINLKCYDFCIHPVRQGGKGKQKLPFNILHANILAGCKPQMQFKDFCLTKINMYKHVT